jgi:hypothetical protein
LLVSVDFLYSRPPEVHLAQSCDKITWYPVTFKPNSLQSWSVQGRTSWQPQSGFSITSGNNFPVHTSTTTCSWKFPLRTFRRFSVTRMAMCWRC